MAATAPQPDDPNPRTSIANLLLPPADLAEKNLLSLSHLAASMTPASPADISSSRRRRAADAFARTRSVPAALRRQHLAPDPLPDDTRRNNHNNNNNSSNLTNSSNRLSRHGSLAAQLGVAHAPGKRLSRSKSGLSTAARKAIAATTPPALASGDTSSADTPRTPQPPARQPPTPQPPTPQPLPPAAAAFSSPTPSPSVLRPISSNPIAGYTSKHTSASNSVESCVPPKSPALKHDVFHAAAARLSTHDYASNALARMRHASHDAMDLDDHEQREPSSSSHDAKLASRPSRSRTTPDAKRAQNRESAKRFRVAQKKRWAELNDTVDRKDAEIQRLKDMLQQVTDHQLARRTPSETRPTADKPTTHPAADSLSILELELFVKLMVAPRDDEKQPPLAANIGSLYRVVVAKTDGSVLGIRHKNSSPAGIPDAMNAEVGEPVWHHVHSSDTAHLRFTVVHAAQMAELIAGEPQVFSYRRRAKQTDTKDDDKDNYIRMKGCVYPIPDDKGKTTSVLLAEFIEK